MFVVFYKEGFMKALRSLIAILLVSLMVLTVASCNGSVAETTATTGQQGTQEGTTNESTAGETFDPLGKYDPEIDLTTVKLFYSWVAFPEGDSIEDNVWTRRYKDELGINVEFSWIVPEDQYQTKLNASIASNDIPDIMNVDEPTFVMCVKSGLIQPLDEVFSQYASDDLKSQVYGGELGEASFNYGKIDGKLMALPGPMSHPVEGASVLYIRKDWLDNLSLSEPKSLDDVFAIIEAFTKNDPDGNGENDTFGIGISNDALASGFAYGIGDVLGIYNGYHANPGIWQEDSSGNLVFGSIQPEMKPALAKINELFKAGYIDKEFGVKDRWKVGEDVAAGKIGLLYGVGWTPVVPLVNSYKNDDSAIWKAYPIPSIDNEPAKVNGWSWGSGFNVVSKNCKNPEALIKLANLSFDTLHGSYAKANPDALNTFVRDKEGKYEAVHYQVVSMYPGDKNLKNQFALKEALNNNDPSKLSPEVINQYNAVVKWLHGDRTVDPWNNWHLKEALGVVAFDYYEKDLYLANKFNAVQTPTMLEKMGTLNDMASQVFTKIIMEGNTDAEFDMFVDNWKKLGGDTITQEVNDWYKSLK